MSSEAWIKSEQAKENCQSHQRLPVTLSILLQIRHILLANPTDLNNIMHWAAFLVCFFGFLHLGEITIPDLSSYDPSVHLNFSDIAADNPHSPSIMQIRMKASKTDPFRQGVDVYIGKTNNALQGRRKQSVDGQAQWSVVR